MEIIFTGMNEYQKEMIFKFGEVVVTLENKTKDEYEINIDPGNYDFFNPYTRETSEYSNLGCRLEVCGGYRGEIGHWYIERPICGDVFYSGFIRNGERFKGNQINLILNAVKSSVDFIQAHGGSIRNVVEEITHIGKMTLKSKKIDNGVYECSIEGMKLSDKVNEYWKDDEIYCVAFENGEFTISNYKGGHYTENLCGTHFKFSSYSDNYSQGYVPLNCFKVTEAELKELKELLQKCSDRLHKINEPTPSASCNKDKMTIKVTPVNNDMVTLEITGMKDPDEFGDEDDYSMCARYWKDDNTICLYGEEEGESLELDRCDSKFGWICIGSDHPMSKETAEMIITYLGAAAAKLHAIRHRDKEYTLVL